MRACAWLRLWCGDIDTCRQQKVLVAPRVSLAQGKLDPSDSNDSLRSDRQRQLEGWEEKAEVETESRTGTARSSGSLRPWEAAGASSRQNE